MDFIKNKGISERGRGRKHIFKKFLLRCEVLSRWFDHYHGCNSKYKTELENSIEMNLYMMYVVIYSPSSLIEGTPLKTVIEPYRDTFKQKVLGYMGEVCSCC